ncbi:hypothetical protein BEWA_023230 [Theileria equi strain WA]|uniref:Uncharacterized protein n=1 Tax=Theileria equi strain WA TaxID=1537102 RepID=L0AX63_THEEQ|nr:hypothetical protein BEWA_023230 [Theileria equi strain WA]AFZ79474.1 hypothetical protein BEWA_023230 [Theileria equi strain WA]|eukprot:XP_004829140.1 hypothetical protein BEWA_023230 [Theileria equi strain WA]
MASPSGLESGGCSKVTSQRMGNEIYEDTPMTSSVLQRRILEASSDISIIKNGMLEVHSDSSVLDVSNRESIDRDSVDIIGEFNATPGRDFCIKRQIKEEFDMLGINDDSIIDIEALLEIPKQVDDRRGNISQRDREFKRVDDPPVVNLDDFSESDFLAVESKELEAIEKDDPCLSTPVRTFHSVEDSNHAINVDSITSSILEICTRDSVNMGDIDDTSINGNVDLYATPVNAMVDLDCPLNAGSFGFSSDPFVYLEENPLDTPEKTVLPDKTPEVKRKIPVPETVINVDESLKDNEEYVIDSIPVEETSYNTTESKSIEPCSTSIPPLKIVNNTSKIQTNIIQKNPRLSSLKMNGTKKNQVDKGDGLKKRVNSVRRKGITVKNNAKLETMPVWVRQPNDIKEIPSYIKMISNRLLHIEKQIKKFCEERQGLLCSIWKLSNNGYKHLLPDPVIKSLSTMENASEQPADSAESSAPSNRMSLRTSLDNIDFDGHLVNYNQMDEEKARDGDTMYWKASWLGDQDMHTPATKRILETYVSRPINVETSSKQTNSSRRTSVSAYINSFKRTSIPKRDSVNSVSSVQERESKAEANVVQDPIEYFKQIDFPTLSYQEMEGWRKFFGIKVSLRTHSHCFYRISRIA